MQDAKQDPKSPPPAKPQVQYLGFQGLYVLGDLAMFPAFCLALLCQPGSCKFVRADALPASLVQCSRLLCFALLCCALLCFSPTLLCLNLFTVALYASDNTLQDLFMSSLLPLL